MNDVAFSLLVRLIQLTCLEQAGVQPPPKCYPALTAEQLCSEQAWSSLNSAQRGTVERRLSAIVKRGGLPLVRVEAAAKQPAAYRFSSKLFNKMGVFEDHFETAED